MTVFSHPLFSVMNSYYAQEIAAEFFFYSRSLNEEFIVYIRQNDYDPYLIFDFFRHNGEYVFTKKHRIPGVRRGEYSKVLVKLSPNGKYLFYKELHDPPLDDNTGSLDESKYRHTQTERMYDTQLDHTELHEGGEGLYRADSENVIDSSSEERSYSDEEESEESGYGSSKFSKSISPPVRNKSPLSSPSEEAKKRRTNGNFSTFRPSQPNSSPLYDSAVIEQSESVSVVSNDLSVQKPVGTSNRDTDNFSRLSPVQIEEEKGFYKCDSSRMEAKIFELVLIRRSSTMNEIFQYARGLQKESHDERISKIKKKVNDEEIMFDLKLVRTVKDVNKYYGDLSDKYITL